MGDDSLALQRGAERIFSFATKFNLPQRVKERDSTTPTSVSKAFHILSSSPSLLSSSSTPSITSPRSSLSLSSSPSKEKQQEKRGKREEGEIFPPLPSLGSMIGPSIVSQRELQLYTEKRRRKALSSMPLGTCVKGRVKSIDQRGVWAQIHLVSVVYDVSSYFSGPLPRTTDKKEHQTTSGTSTPTPLPPASNSTLSPFSAPTFPTSAAATLAPSHHHFSQPQYPSQTPQFSSQYPSQTSPHLQYPIQSQFQQLPSDSAQDFSSNPFPNSINSNYYLTTSNQSICSNPAIIDLTNTQQDQIGGVGILPIPTPTSTPTTTPCSSLLPSPIPPPSHPTDPFWRLEYLQLKGTCLVSDLGTTPMDQTKDNIVGSEILGVVLNYDSERDEVLLSCKWEKVVSFVEERRQRASGDNDVERGELIRPPFFSIRLGVGTKREEGKNLREMVVVAGDDSTFIEETKEMFKIEKRLCSTPLHHLLYPKEESSSDGDSLKKGDSDSKMTVMARLETSRLFNNPAGLDQWIEYFHFGQNQSLLFSHSPSPERHYLAIRKEQNYEWAHVSVRKGVSYAKEKNYEEAMKCYNDALEVDPQHADAFVARGAAYANQLYLKKAVGEFEKALDIDSEHVNAKMYLEKCREKIREGGEEREEKREGKVEKRDSRERRERRDGKGERRDGKGERRDGKGERRVSSFASKNPLLSSSAPDCSLTGRSHSSSLSNSLSSSSKDQESVSSSQKVDLTGKLKELLFVEEHKMRKKERKKKEKAGKKREKKALDSSSEGDLRNSKEREKKKKKRESDLDKKERKKRKEKERYLEDSYGRKSKRSRDYYYDDLSEDEERKEKRKRKEREYSDSDDEWGNTKEQRKKRTKTK